MGLKSDIQETKVFLRVLGIIFMVNVIINIIAIERY